MKIIFILGVLVAVVALFLWVGNDIRRLIEERHNGKSEE